MDRKWERVCWVAVAVGALTGGAMIGKVRSFPEADTSAEGRLAKGDRNDRGGGGMDGVGDHRAERKDETELRRMANHALSTPRRTERYQRLMAMLDDTTAENWNTLWKEYIRQTLEEGRVHETEWSLFMNRVGEVAGPDAMEYFSHHGQEEYTFNRREVLLGWAGLDPAGALAWLKEQPAESQPVEFWGAVMQGASSNDTRLAMDLLSEIPDNLSAPVVRSTADSLIQTEGLAHTAELLESKVAEIPAGDPMPERLRVFYQELEERSGRMKWLAESYPDMNSRQPSLEKLAEVFDPGASDATIDGPKR